MMGPDEWVVTETTTLANGNKVVRGVHANRGPFQVTIPLEEYATMGVHAAVRAFYDNHPADKGPRR